MTWNTPNGMRVLEGAELRLYAAGMRSILDEVEAFSLRNYVLQHIQPSYFDSLTRVTLPLRLAEILAAMTQPEVPALRLTPENEALAFAPFYQVLHRVRLELVLAEMSPAAIVLLPDDNRWRALIMAAHAVLHSENPTPLMTASAPEVWARAVQDIAEQIFWDRGWERRDDRSPVRDVDSATGDNVLGSTFSKWLNADVPAMQSQSMVTLQAAQLPPEIMLRERLQAILSAPA